MTQPKQAGLWARIKHLWQKWRGRRVYDGPTLSEHGVVDKFGDAFARDGVLNRGPEILRQLVVEANKVQLPPQYLPYVFHLWVKDRKSWPHMRPRQRATLNWARSLVIQQGEMPNYQPAVVIPPAQFEAAIDQILTRLAFWVSTKVAANMVRAYSETLKRWAPYMIQAVGNTLPANKASPYLEVLFSEYLRRKPTNFLGGYLLETAYFTIMGMD